MKHNFVKVFIVLTVSLLILLFILTKNTKKLPIENHKIIEHSLNRSKSVRIITNKTYSVQLTSIAEITPLKVAKVSFEVGGILLSGEIEFMPKTKFKKNQLLFRIDNRKQFIEMTKNKAKLSKSIEELLKENERIEDIEKWNECLSELKPGKRLPNFPSLKNEKEIKLFSEKGCIELIKKIQQEEIDMEKYFYLAPFDGEFLSSIKEIGAETKPNELIAQILPNNSFVAQIKETENKSTLFQKSKNVTYFDENGNQKGKGKLLSAQNNLTYSIDARLMNPKKGMQVTAKTDFISLDNCVSISPSLVKGNQVKVLKGDKKVIRTVNIIYQDSAKVYVRGLKDGDRIGF